MSNPTPTPAALREALAALWNDIAAIEASRRGEAAWRQAYDRCQGIIESLPLDPGEAPAPAGDQTGTPSPQGLGEARTPREVEYHRGYTQGMTDAMKNFDKLVAGLRNPPPILVDASKLNPDVLASLLAKAPEARSAPPSSEGSPSSSPSVPPAPAPKGEVEAPTLHDMGYEPGDYFNHCHRCKAGFLGDKRAFTCHSCAAEMRGEKMLEARQSPQGSGEAVAEPVPTLTEEQRRIYTDPSLTRYKGVTPSAAPPGPGGEQVKAAKLRFKDFGEVEHDPGAMHPIRVATVHTYRGQGVWAMSLRKAKAIHAQLGKAIQREESAARRVVGKGGK